MSTQADHEASNEALEPRLTGNLALASKLISGLCDDHNDPERDVSRAECSVCLTAALDAVRDAEREMWVEACRVAWKDAHKAATFARSWHGGHSHEVARSHEATADAIHALARRLGVTL
jgi:hypothetical protein